MRKGLGIGLPFFSEHPPSHPETSYNTINLVSEGKNMAAK